MQRPNSFFKYYKKSKHTLEGLKNNTIWLAKPSIFNDPYDCALTLSENKYRESVLHAISASISAPDCPETRKSILEKEWPGDRDAFNRAKQKILNIFQNCGICCFTENDKNILMWSHYTDNHTGFCVEYDFNQTPSYKNLPQKVIYQKEIPQLSIADFAPGSSDGTFDKLWLIKAIEWKYENEWRVIMSEGNQSYAAPEMISVTFGAKTTDEDKLEIMESLKERPHVFFKQASLSQEKFEIEILY